VGGRRVIDLTGQVFGRLTAVRRSGFARNGEVTWLCVCSCGAEVPAVQGANLRSGNSKSCGCYSLESVRLRMTTHGHSRKGQWSSEYGIWAAMIARCHNPNCRAFKWYGAIGREVYRPWHKFENFIAYVSENLGPKPAGFTLDRIDNESGYFPGNIRWASWDQQANNRRKRRRKNSAGTEPSLPMFN